MLWKWESVEFEVSVPKNHLLQKLKRIGEKFQSESDYAFSYKNKIGATVELEWWRLSNKKVILVSQFVNNFGSGFSRIALIILVTTWFKNPIYVGVYSFFLFVPNILLATPIGYFIDSCRNQKKLLISTSFLSAIAVLGIVLLTYFKVKSFFLLVFFAIVYNLVSGFYMPVVTKITVQIFDRNEYNDINAAISTAMTGANLFSGIIVTFFISFLFRAF